MSSGFKINPSDGKNPNTDPRILVRLAYHKILTDAECDAILAEWQLRAEEERQAWLNDPILPPSGSDEYEIIKKEVPYGGTNGNPVTEGVQNIVTISVYNERYDHYTEINFYNKEELNKFISELQQVADHLN